MLTLILSVAIAVLVSAFCSMSEAMLYSVPWSFIEKLRKDGKKAGEHLYYLRQNVEKPITAILTLNTVANTAGAAVAGAAAAAVFEPEQVWIFTAGFTLLILALGEILPKTVGVAYNRRLAPYLAVPIQVMIVALTPLIWVGGLMARMVRPKRKGPVSTEEDLRAVVSLTRKEGVIKPYEELSIKNILSLDDKTVSDIMTPRTVVFSLAATMTTGMAKGTFWPHSRIPVHDADDPEDMVGIVYRRQVLEALANDQDNLTMAQLMKPVRFVLESMTLDRLLVKFLESRTHLFVVLDEYGGVSGVVSLEDVLEEILGKEIVDETDQVADMRELARTRRSQLLTKMTVPGDSDEPPRDG
ncbi:HlyC/CorC family transporter [Desulfovibrio sulfodismutans]|uniref:HlyC/CorC family transporter n=1 Tax=Desulfolutivibrio sulfodismutans TaxID=63561 RepID=A0A7K3NMI8_9BACT|nr:hemolysin family protein [Desulfolutivibrio sulfodismutans]NDY56985.1 HlyC/CorC family transporter [Desulfolutivibrio sulfodismutans]QLA12068.1 DUF21 domain-containing protein [Desulfolutivibrio sulfodismutans DSM 3696]